MYEIIFQNPARNFLKKLDKENQVRIIRKLRELSNNPRLGKPLVGKLSGLWSLRVGKYRLLYDVRREELTILIIDIGHRKNIYD